MAAPSDVLQVLRDYGPLPAVTIGDTVGDVSGLLGPLADEGLIERVGEGALERYGLTRQGWSVTADRG